MKKDIFDVIQEHQQKTTVAAAEELESLASALREGRVLRWLWAFVLRQYWVWTVVGTLVLGLGFPIVLVLWNGGATEPVMIDGPTNPPVRVPLAGNNKEEQATAIVIGSVIFCGPPAVFFALLIYNGLRVRAREERMTCGRLAGMGAAIGGVTAFLNMPGYLALVFLQPGPVPVWVRLILLFIVAGVSCGVWISWQAWRSAHKEAPFFPQYSLKWMMVLVICWAGLLAIYSPR